jgi:lysozyme
MLNNSLRRAIAVLVLSAAGLVGIVSQEDYTDRAVIPLPGDVPTLGFGATEGVKLGDRTTPPKALARALSDVGKYEGAMRQCVTVPLNQHEYDAFVSLAYNIGPSAFCKSTLVSKLNALDYVGACTEILRWRHFKGKDCSDAQNRCSGLWLRRQAESNACLGLNP